MAVRKSLKNVERPWNKERARERYIYGNDDISLVELAKESKIELKLLQKWCSVNSWVAERDKYALELRRIIHNKILERESEAICQDLIGLAKCHLAKHRKFSDFAERWIDAKIEEANLAKAESREKERAFLASLNPDQFDKIHLALSRAIDGERKSTGLDLEINPNTAIQVLAKLGYTIIETISGKEIHAAHGEENYHSIAQVHQASQQRN